MNELLFCAHLTIISLAQIVMVRLGLSALVAFLCAQAIIANFFVLKQITLWGYNATAADIYIVGSVLTLNLIQEYYGKQEARKAIWTSFSLLIFYTIVSQLQLAYVASIADFAHAAYAVILSHMPRITIASLAVYLMVQYFDTFFYGRLRTLCKGHYITARNMISIFASQLLDTVLFSFLGLYGIVENITQIMLVSFTIKMIAMLLLVPLVVTMITRVEK